MNPISKQQIDSFLSAKTIAIAGASRKENSFSDQVAKHLTQAGYNLLLINPNFEQTTANKLTTVSELPADVSSLLILSSKAHTETILKEALAKGIKNIWIQQMSDTPEALKLGLASMSNFIYGQCIFKLSNAAGIHKFHYKLTKFFGGLPRST